MGSVENSIFRMSYYPSPPKIPGRKPVSSSPFGGDAGPSGWSNPASNAAGPGAGYGGPPTGSAGNVQSSNYGGPSEGSAGYGNPQSTGYGGQSAQVIAPVNPTGYGYPQSSGPVRSPPSYSGRYGNPQSQIQTVGYGGPPSQSAGYPVAPSQSSTGYGGPPSGEMKPMGVSAPVTAPGSSSDWFSQSGFATALGAAAMSAVAGNESAATQMVATAFGGAFDAEKQKSLSWFQSQTVLFREYFNVTHAYVRWKLLYVILPFVQPNNPTVSRAVSRDVPHGSDDQTGQGSGVGLRLFPGRKPDMYIPIMGFITFVLMHSLSRWHDFHPDDMYNISSLGILLGIIEVLLVKGASYVMNVPNWSLMDIVSVCGYKFTNLSISVILLMMIGSVGGRAAWIALFVFAAATAGLTVQRGLLAAGNYNAQQQMGSSGGGMERMLAVAAGAGQFLWIWILMPSMKVIVITVATAASQNIRQGIESTSST